VADRESANASAAKASESLSQFLARVFDQLSISAWLPAAALVGLLLLFGELRANDGKLGEALADIGDLSIGSLVLLLACVVIGTMVTQAFEFEAIRLLEGYWGPGFVGRHLAGPGTRWHTWRRARLQQWFHTLEDEAFASARQVMLKRKIPPEVVEVLERERTGASVGMIEPAAATTARAVDWRRFGPTSKVRLLDNLVTKLKDYPAADHRILPTRLGNVLRAAEDRSFTDRVDRFETAVIETFHELPVALQSEHDQHRSRLELYCSMVIVLVVVAAAAYPLLHSVGWQLPVILATVGAVLSYRAAIFSARKYGLVLDAVASIMADRQRP
jgi:hypothetical protein